jgi:intein/homing endonuclease
VDWFEKNPDADLLVECINPEDGEKTIGLAHSPRIGQISDEMIEIELDSGEIIRCTPNHPFLVNGEWIKAGDLLEGTEIKDFYHHE